MTHVHRKLWQVGLDISTLAVPAQQTLNRETVTKVVDSWSPPVPTPNVRRLDQFLQTGAQAGAGIALATPRSVAQQRLRRCRHAPLLLATNDVLAQFCSGLCR